MRAKPGVRKFDIETVSDEQRLEYWNTMSEKQVFGLYRQKTIKFVREKTKEITDEYYALDPNVTVHEVGCAYVMTMRQINPAINFLGTDMAENMIKGCREMYADLPNACFEVESIESAYEKGIRADVTLVLCMMDSIAHDYSLELLGKVLEMSNKAVLFISQRHEFNRSKNDPNWDWSRNFNSHDPQEIVELAEKYGYNTSLDVREGYSNFAAVMRRK